MNLYMYTCMNHRRSDDNLKYNKFMLKVLFPERKLMKTF